MKRYKVLITAIALIVAVMMIGAYPYATGFFNEKKDLVVLLPKHIDKLYYLYPYGDNYPALIIHYWLGEYHRLHTWTIQKDGLNLTIYPEYVTGDDEFESISFVVTLNASTYVEKVKYISDAMGMAKENGGFVETQIVSENYEDKRISGEDVNLPEDPSVEEWKIYQFNMANFSFLCHAYTDIHMKHTNASLPYNFTAYVETKNKIYKMEFMFNITDEHYPYLEPEYNYTTGATYFNITGATYFCYVDGNVVISDHIVDGTQYYFVEKNGMLSKILEAKK